jgi:hypothetical protein
MSVGGSVLPVVNILIMMNIERTELGLWLLVPEPVVRPERRRKIKAQGLSNEVAWALLFETSGGPNGEAVNAEGWSV